MANTILRFNCTPSLTLTLDLYPEGSDTATASAKTCTENTNAKGEYSCTISEVATGRNHAHIKSGSAVIAVFPTQKMADDTGTYWAADWVVDVTYWGSAAITVPASAGRPSVDAIAAGGVTWGSGAITAASIATDAIDADSLATDAVTEINTNTLAAIAGIGTAGGAAINVDATTDNAAGGITGVTSGTVKVGTETGTFANASFVDGSYHLITHATNAIDWVYQFLTGGGTNVVSATWTGYLDGSNDTITFSAWNHVGGAWEAIGTQAGQAGSANVTKTLVLYARHRGTSAAELGKVYFRVSCTGMTSPVLRTDAISISYAVTSRSVGYANGGVWIDTLTGTAGTESFVNGVADNPVLSLADALTIATANNLRIFEIGNGSTITLAATTSNKVFEGHEWNLALGGQIVSDSMFIDANVSGISSGTNAEFQTCSFAAATIGPSFCWECSFAGTLTLAATGDYFFYNCHSAVAGTSSPVFDLGALGAQNISFRRWSGGITISNIASGDVISIDVISGGTVTLNGVDGNVQVRGMCNIVDNRTGSPTLGTTNNMDTRLDTIDTNLATIVADTNELQTDWANGGRLDLILDTAAAGGSGGAPLILTTTIATLASQTSFTLTAGSADNDAYNNLSIVITDQSTATQKAYGTISDYVGATKTITMTADPAIFTMAVGDTVEIVLAGTQATAGADITMEINDIRTSS